MTAALIAVNPLGSVVDAQGALGTALCAGGQGRAGVRLSRQSRAAGRCDGASFGAFEIGDSAGNTTIGVIAVTAVLTVAGEARRHYGARRPRACHSSRAYAV